MEPPPVELASSTRSAARGDGSDTLAAHGRARLPDHGRLAADDVARFVLFAVSQPPHVDVNELLVRPTSQTP
jgi:NADP-dependent 3-hydroxy acid dehydrogenase YdfG